MQNKKHIHPGCFIVCAGTMLFWLGVALLYLHFHR